MRTITKVWVFAFLSAAAIITGASAQSVVDKDSAFYRIDRIDCPIKVTPLPPGSGIPACENEPSGGQHSVVRKALPFIIIDRGSVFGGENGFIRRPFDRK